MSTDTPVIRRSPSNPWRIRPTKASLTAWIAHLTAFAQTGLRLGRDFAPTVLRFGLAGTTPP